MPDGASIGLSLHFAIFFAKFGWGEQSAKFAQNLGLRGEIWAKLGFMRGIWDNFQENVGNFLPFFGLFLLMLAVLGHGMAKFGSKFGPDAREMQNEIWGGPLRNTGSSQKLLSGSSKLETRLVAL